VIWHDLFRYEREDFFPVTREKIVRTHGRAARRGARVAHFIVGRQWAGPCADWINSPANLEGRSASFLCLVASLSGESGSGPNPLVSPEGVARPDGGGRGSGVAVAPPRCAPTVATASASAHPSSVSSQTASIPRTAAYACEEAAAVLLLSCCITRPLRRRSHGVPVRVR
jgi:hypothetical protein